MKKIYIGHSNSFDFINELYKPINRSLLVEQFNVVMPHKDKSTPYNSRDFLKQCDYMIA